MGKKQPGVLAGRRRQWGSEKRLHPLPIVHNKPSTRQMAFSRLSIVATVSLWAMYVIATIIRQFFYGPKSFEFTLQAFGYLVVVTFLTFSALMYLLARQGALMRFSKHVRVPRAELDRHFSEQQPSITVLVPSYAEEPGVIRKTLMSAALQEYPGMHVVLLVDDSPHPTNQAAAQQLDATRALGTDIMKLFAEPRERFAAVFTQFDQTHSKTSFVNAVAIKKLADEYVWAANWLNTLADAEEMEDHVDVFFADQVLRGLAKELQLMGDALMASCGDNARLAASRVGQLYRRLAWIFDADLKVFERKKFASLSHESNKAMNLNSYIGLMGGTYHYEITPDGPVLLPVVRRRPGDVTIPDSEFVLTLDADSILLRDYCLRLVYFLQQSDNARVAVTQTPYSSFRGAATRIERLAAATTDIQHILHQGMSQYGAAFWVGANAVIRKKALEDIAETEWVGGFQIKRYIQDRTVIEDTESSVDLALHGWTLANYPERLSYSATPPDFGSLVVQRRRWANGGLLILPKLIKQIRERKRRGEMVSTAEVLLRLNYMASIAWASFGLIFLLAFPYDSRLLSPFVLLAALPYFFAMGSDLKYCGYKRTDVLRIYGFNLILLPVNLAGVLKSIQQALSGKKIPFARTPKVKNRTASPLLYVITPLLIVGFSIFTLWRDTQAHNWANAAFAGFNALLAAWAIMAYIGIWATVVDTWLGVTKWLYVEVRQKAVKAAEAVEPTLDWRAVLYHGEASGKVPLSAAKTVAVRGDKARRQYVPLPVLERRKRLSPVRVVLAFPIIAALAMSGTVGMDHWQSALAVASSAPWFAGYVDVTATPRFAFEQMGQSASKDAVLSFIVSLPSDACTPSWGGAYTMAQAGDSLDLDRRIARLQQQGGSVAVSFGGMLHDELAVKCADPDKLKQAYASVVDRYDVSTIDLDLERGGLTDPVVGARRATIVADLQKERRAAGKKLAVWVTLPATPQGLSLDGTNGVTQLLKGGVDLAGVNVMTMDYGQSLAKGESMESGSEKALTQTVRQLGILYEQAGVHLNNSSLWAKIGATPMIGQNDDAGEVFTLEDAAGFNKFTRSHGISRMSMWSANRDKVCGSNYVDLRVVSDSCSGVKQDNQSFATLLGDGFKGSLALSAGFVTTADPVSKDSQKPDDPATSPYPVWKENGSYLEGTKVVWRHNVYQAKWWTQGDSPDNPVLQEWQTPWDLIGPVLPGEKPIVQPTLPAGTYPEWEGDTAYNTGGRVLYKGVPYQAKWWTQGDSPEAATSNASGSPWVPLTQAQINEIIAAQTASQ
jgi:cellulose synthase (UDP-forming)